MKLPTEAQCKRASSLFNEVLDPAHRYAERKRLTARPFAGYIKANELWEGFPENWEENVLGMLAAGAVFTRPDRVAAFLRSARETLRNELLAMVRTWRARPWAWAFFDVLEDLGDRRLRIVPVGPPPSTWTDAERWQEILVYSRAVADNYHRGSRLFFTQLVDAGPAFVTYGAVIPFRGLEEADVLFIADVVRHVGLSPGAVPLLGIADPQTPVSDIVASNPFPFLATLRYSETPPVRTRQGAPGRYASWVTLPDVPDAWSQVPWREAAEAAAERVAAIVIDDDGGGIAYGDGSPMYDPAIYLSRKDARAFLEARTRVGYDRGRAAAAGIAEFPRTPEVAAGIVAVAAAAQIVGLDESLLDQCGVLRERYEDELIGAPAQESSTDEDEESLPPSVDEFQAIADRLLRNHNEGIHEETGTIAADLGVAPAVVDSVREKLEESFSRMFDGENELPGADRFGLSPRAFAQLVRGSAPDVAGVLRLRDTEELRNAQSLMALSPYQRGVQWLLDRAMSDKGLPATQAGYISPAVVVEAHGIGIVESITDFDTEPSDEAQAASRAEFRERFRPKKESDWRALLRLRSLAESAHLLKLSGKAFTPTDTAQRLVDDPAALYRHLLVTAFRTFEWAAGGRFDCPPELHRMAGFLFYAAGELCDARRNGARDGAPTGSDGEEDWVPVRMLADRFVAAVPSLAQAVSEEASAEVIGERRSFGIADRVRTDVNVFIVDQFGVHFGLLQRAGLLGEEARLRTTPLYEAVFERG